jgi:uncharacterized phage protein (TIGR01671 family)
MRRKKEELGMELTQFVPTFRAWDVDRQKMVLSEDLVIEIEGSDILISESVYEDWGVDSRTINNYVIMMASGFKDIDGHLLYTGDIFQTDEYPLKPENGYVGVIDYEYGSFIGIRWVKKGATVSGISHGQADLLSEFKESNIKQIGNIFEHPYLLGRE